ncbi:TonB-dependent receptor plug domain-containing protein [Mucilaginibacter pedocola]|uniref:TonB-dependent receptor plug domain-containing protein n=1 Tax=Mucilaginibacter pedocola TaxID=1792845 RepID=A0A1S9PMS2_9SPHI|nr:TonB-dependent receptor plug domain-containing protein [Mucilaginibacter pedocola]OOQ62240.1 hypothetical protein BC343_04135 [Mucilaginibacter pedocola]
MKNEVVPAVLRRLRKFRAAIIPAMLLLCFAFVWRVDPGDKIATLLADYSAKFPQEKVHLHLDRNYFAAGDTLNFKAYVVTAADNHLSDTSRVLYITLADTTAGYSTTLQYPLEGGTVAGTLELPDSLKAGNYNLTAYTGWMKNFGEGFFYHATISVGLLNGTNTAPQKKTTGTPHIYFFPEGGSLVEKLTSVVGVKAIDANGKGIAASGSIVDESGKSITTFQTGFAGMGRLNLKPESAHKYFALIKLNGGAETKVPLPAALATGYVLAVDNTDKQQIKVGISYSGPAATQPVLLVAQANNKYITSATATLAGNSASVALKRRDFPTGVVQLTLFAASGAPLAERLIFVNRNDQLKLNVADAATNGSHKVTLEATDALLNPVKGEFSVSVVDQSRYADSLSMPSIMADLLLTSDLKGTIENPNHYFNEGAADAAASLDNLMLTQGWRRFKWADVLSRKYPQALHSAEKNQVISGVLLSTKGKPLPNGKVMLVAKGDSAYTITTVADSMGRFVFDLPVTLAERKFSIIGNSASGSNLVRILPDAQDPEYEKSVVPGFSDVGIANRLSNYLTTSKQYIKDGLRLPPNVRQLKVVEIKAKQPTPREKALEASSNLNGPGNADQVVDYHDLENCNLLETCLEGKLTGVYFKTEVDKNSNEFKKIPYATGGMGKRMLIVLDGVPVVPPNELRLNNIPASNVQTIEVLRTGAKLVMYGMNASGGALIITTKQGGIDYGAVDRYGRRRDPTVTNFAVYTYPGYHTSREFYNPPVNAQPPQKVKPRETIYWNARVKTDDDGKASFEFATAPGTKKLAIIVEGLSDEGKTGYVYSHQN